MKLKQYKNPNKKLNVSKFHISTHGVQLQSFVAPTDNHILLVNATQATTHFVLFFLIFIFLMLISKLRKRHNFVKKGYIRDILGMFS